MSGSGGGEVLAGRLPGVLAAVLTPFAPGTEEIDPGALERECDWLVGARPAAAVIGGVETQEYQVFEGEHREKMIGRCLQALDGRLPAIVGVTHPSRKRRQELSRFAARSGAEAVMVLVGLKPWGARPTLTEMVATVEEVAEAAGLPVVVYNNPRTGVDMSVEEMARLAQIDPVWSFKETSRDIAKIGRLLTEIDAPRSARIFTTMEALLFTVLMGGPGAMMPPPAVAPAVAMIQAAVQGDMESATQLQSLLVQFPARWMRLGLTPVMKEAMKHAGVDLGGPLAPYASLDPAETQAIGELFATHPAARALEPAVGLGVGQP